MNTKNEIKSHISNSNLKYFEIIEKMNNYGIDTTTNAFTNKLNRDTVRYSEVKVISDILDCEINWIYKSGINPDLISKLNDSDIDTNVLYSFIHSIFALANPLNKNIIGDLQTITLFLKNKELYNALIKSFEYLIKE